jgi:hypothetical protein
MLTGSEVEMGCNAVALLLKTIDVFCKEKKGARHCILPRLPASDYAKEGLQAAVGSRRSQVAAAAAGYRNFLSLFALQLRAVVLDA